MKKRNFIMITVCALVVCMLAFSLAGCLKIGMRERNLEARMDKAGATVTHERTAPMLRDGTSAQLSGIGTIMACYMNVSDRDPETGEEFEHEDMLYVIYANNDPSAKWAKEAAKTWLENIKSILSAGEELPEGVDSTLDYENWNVYDFENLVMCGHYRILSVARGY